MLSNSVVSRHTKQAYLTAFDDLIKLAASRPISRLVLMEYRATMVAEGLSAATINLRLCGIRKLVNEARENGLIDPAEAVRLTSVPGVPQNGVRLGTWLTREETRRLLAAVDRSELIGKRNFAILSVLCLCALRREELAKLDSGLIQLREGRWVFADLIGKRGRVRTVRFRRQRKMPWTSGPLPRGSLQGRSFVACAKAARSQASRSARGQFGMLCGRPPNQRGSVILDRMICAAMPNAGLCRIEISILKLLVGPESSRENRFGIIGADYRLLKKPRSLSSGW
jgi:hypothetical protein